MAHTTKENRDVYYRKAKEDGYRARSAYKLAQILEAFGIFYPVIDADVAAQRIFAAHSNGDAQLDRIVTIIDLCAAPGSWSQCLRDLAVHEHACYVKALERVPNLSKTSRLYKSCVQEPVIVAVDLQAIAPIKQVKCIKGDITTSSVLEQMLKILGSASVNDCSDDGDVTNPTNTDEQGCRRAQLVVCDGAPDVSGLHETDALVQATLIRAALYSCMHILEPGGTFICKSFSSDPATPIYSKVSLLFGDVDIYKPDASRASSCECFLVARDFKPFDTSNEDERWILRLLSGGDLSVYDDMLIQPETDKGVKTEIPLVDPE